jgi:hypothetical protein
MSSIHERLISNFEFEIEGKPQQLYKELRNILIQSINDGSLKCGPQAVYDHVKISPEDKKSNEYSITGGNKDFKRDPNYAFLQRDDGAWIHFTLTVRFNGKNKYKLLAYDFELVFPPCFKPRFVRLDLNPSDHPNDLRECRSHCHPGHDDLSFPSAVLLPQEALKVLITQMRPRDSTKLRYQWSVSPVKKLLKLTAIKAQILSKLEVNSKQDPK